MAATVAAVLTAGVLTTGVLSTDPAAPASTASASLSTVPATTGQAPVQHGLNSLVRSDGMPAALAAVQDRAGHTRTYTAGVGDLATGAKVPADGQLRIGSNTKTFTAVAVLQLVGEGKVALDAPIETYLPGLVRGDGIDGRRITVRQLLQHTSGLPNYSKYLAEDVRYYDPRDLLDLALAHKADFAPGTKWAYSNTNYVLAGLLVQKVTGRPYAEEIERRVIRRAGLHHTYFPTPGDAKIRGPHPKGYYLAAPGTPLRDGTELDPSWGWAAGQLVSTPSDLNRFTTALLKGRLLAPAQLAQMRTTVPAGAPFATGTGYGLGLVKTPLPCGGAYWGHGGSTTGYETRGGATDDGRAVSIAVTTQPDAPTKQHMDALVTKSLCP
ncbi:serine hydrolase domain-containing protein [Streptomyces sp. NPDC058657]|uniref:serine hydrolase domain-containing protein n=1 Tax=unclassified Streptomyces TaxID=2593676 RepID=UPI003659642A